jgi:hypothetical protein
MLYQKRVTRLSRISLWCWFSFRSCTSLETCHILSTTCENRFSMSIRLAWRFYSKYPLTRSTFC